MAMGVTEIRLLMMGMPYSVSICCPTDTRFFARVVIFSYTFSQARSMSGSMQSSREMPMVMVRISRHSSWIMRMVSRISYTFSISAVLSDQIRCMELKISSCMV